MTPYTAGPTVTLNGGGYNVNLINTLFQNAVVLAGNAVLSATAANTALAGVTSTALPPPWVSKGQQRDALW